MTINYYYTKTIARGALQQPVKPCKQILELCVFVFFGETDKKSKIQITAVIVCGIIIMRIAAIINNRFVIYSMSKEKSVYFVRYYYCR